MRKASLNRTTAETDITMTVCLDKCEKSTIKTGCGFLDHMLTLFAKHSGFTLDVTCSGDTEVDYHHSVEDIGIVMGKCVKEALGDMRGIKRYGSIILPMDEALVIAAIDISGRCRLEYDVSFPTEKAGDFDTELVREFFEAFARCADLTLHLKMLSGSNSHHIAECTFKAFARALGEAVSADDKNKDSIPSTKGTLL